VDRERKPLVHHHAQQGQGYGVLPGGGRDQHGAEFPAGGLNPLGFPGIGKLVLQKRKARKGRNPATGAEIKIPAKTVVKMRVAKACAEAIVPPKKK
jgi:hypothetical protein